MICGFVEPGQSLPADWDERPALSYSIAKEMLTKTPLHAWQMHRLLGGKGQPKKKPTPALERGIIIDHLILGAAEHRIVVVKAPDFRTKAAQQQRDAAYEADKVPVLEEDYAEYEKTAKKLIEQLGPIFGRPKLRAAWLSDEDVLCHGELDGFSESGSTAEEPIAGIDPGAPIIWDLKSCTDAVDASTESNIYNYDYQIQCASYLDCVSSLRPELAEAVQFVLVFAEVTPPYDVRFVKLARSFVEMGQGQWGRAVFMWRECLQSNKWPGSGRKLHEVSAPIWAVRREQDLIARMAGRSLPPAE